MITQEICLIRAEISTQTHFGKCICYLYDQPSFVSDKITSIYCIILEILGQNAIFFYYIINQKRNNFIKHCPPPVYQETSDIRDVYLYEKLSVQVGSWYTGGGTMFHRQKITGVSACNTQNTLQLMENYVNRPLSDKSMNFCKVVVHDLTNDISYNCQAEQIQNLLFEGKIVKILCLKSREIGIYLQYPYLLIYWSTLLQSGSSYIKKRYKLSCQCELVQNQPFA